MRVHIADLKPGDCLAEDIFNQFGLLVLSKDAVLNHHELSRLYQHQIEYVEIDRRSAEQELPQLENAFTRIQSELLPKYQDAVTGFEHIFEKALADAGGNEQAAEQVVVADLRILVLL